MSSKGISEFRLFIGSQLAIYVFGKRQHNSQSEETMDSLLQNELYTQCNVCSEIRILFLFRSKLISTFGLGTLFEIVSKIDNLIPKTRIKLRPNNSGYGIRLSGTI